MALSFVLSFFVLVQFVLGYITRAEMVKSSLSKTLFTVKQAHKVIGNLMCLVGKGLVIIQLYIFT